MGGQMQDNGPWVHCTGGSKLLYDIPQLPTLKPRFRMVYQLSKLEKPNKVEQIKKYIYPS